MTERKPAGASWESWIERQIDEGRRSGAFDDLEGHGSPIDDLDRPHDEMWWVKAKLQREDVIVTPPTIAIRTERDRVLADVMSAPDESTVRSMIEELNEQIRDVNRYATWGPPSSLAPLDLEPIVERWRTHGTPPQPLADVPAEPDPLRPWPRRWLDALRRALRPRTTGGESE